MFSLIALYLSYRRADAVAPRAAAAPKLARRPVNDRDTAPVARAA